MCMLAEAEALEAKLIKIFKRETWCKVSTNLQNELNSFMWEHPDKL